MGKIKEIIQKADQAKELTAETKETLNLLYELSKEKAETFENKISTSLRTAGTPENPTVPITVVLGSHQEIRVTTSSTPNEDIVNGIGDTLKNILTGSKEGIINGLTGLINNALNVVLGAAEGEERMEHSYYIATEGLAIVRLDLMYWSRHITAKGITKYAEKSLVCSAVKSSVNLEKVDFNAFLSSYQAQLVRCQFKEEELIEEITNARKIYKILTDKSGNGKENMLSGARNTLKLPEAQGFKMGEFGVLQSVKTEASSIWPSKSV